MVYSSIPKANQLIYILMLQGEEKSWYTWHSGSEGLSSPAFRLQESIVTFLKLFAI